MHRVGIFPGEGMIGPLPAAEVLGQTVRRCGQIPRRRSPAEAGFTFSSRASRPQVISSRPSCDGPNPHDMVVKRAMVRNGHK